MQLNEKEISEKVSKILKSVKINFEDLIKKNKLNSFLESFVAKIIVNMNEKLLNKIQEIKGASEVPEKESPSQDAANEKEESKLSQESKQEETEAEREQNKKPDNEKKEEEKKSKKEGEGSTIISITIGELKRWEERASSLQNQLKVKALQLEKAQSETTLKDNTIKK
jgi:hypothetical protein